MESPLTQNERVCKISFFGTRNCENWIWAKSVIGEPLLPERNFLGIAAGGSASQTLEFVKSEYLESMNQ
jgi:hypothetical protein